MSQDKNNLLLYYWIDGQVVIKSWGKSGSVIREAYCVDDDDFDATNRYGMFNGPKVGGWKHIPIEEFPKEFRVHLLLLGVA